jgi:HSP20 family protein
MIRFNPFAEVTSLRDQVNRLFDEVAPTRPTGREGGNGPRVYAPLLNLCDTQDALTITLDVPGVDRDAIDVQLAGDTLTIRGERKWDRQEGQHYLHVERPFGAFQRQVTIGYPVQPDRVNATYRDGVLTVTLPKAEELKPRKVQIQMGEGQ